MDHMEPLEMFLKNKMLTSEIASWEYKLHVVCYGGYSLLMLQA